MQIYADNDYTMPALVDELARRRTYYVGTVRGDRCNADILSFADKVAKTLNPGESVYQHSANVHTYARNNVFKIYV